MEYVYLIFDSSKLARTDRITAIFKCKHRVPRASSFIYKTLEKKAEHSFKLVFFRRKDFEWKEKEEQETEMEKNSDAMRTELYPRSGRDQTAGQRRLCRVL